MRTPRPYADATRGGIALGLVLLVSFAFAGRGVGASGAFAAVAGATIQAGAPEMLAANPALADRLPPDAPLLNDWIVLQLAGVFVGGALSAWWCGRWHANRRAVPPQRSRLTRALIGGTLMGLGARLAYGCTSGLALTGGALLATGAWVFIPIAFGTAVIVTLVARDHDMGGVA